MHISEDYEALLAEKGIDLSDLSIAGSALRREDAFTAIKLLQRDSVPLLGGEVFLKENSKISFPVDLGLVNRSEVIPSTPMQFGVAKTRARISLG